MVKLSKAPHLGEPWNNQPYSDLLVLAGGNAWGFWDKGKGIGWQMLADALKIEPFISTNGKTISRYEQKPVILGDTQLADIDRLRIANPEQRFIKLIQCGELAESQKTVIALNIASNTQAEKVTIYDCYTLEKSEDLSGYIARLRQGETEIAKQLQQDSHKIKENDRTNEKSRAFKKWLGLDIALQRGSREVYAYDGKIWSKLETDDLEEKAVNFLDESSLGYSDKTINSLINTLKAQLPRMEESSNDLIAFNNGVLNRNTLQFQEHKRDHWLTACIPHNYDDNATETPNFDKWLIFVSNNNPVKSRNILAALYAILTNRYNWQIFFEVTGKGGSGKSIFASIATLLAGEKNTASGKLENFDDEKGLDGFENKTLILCPEQSKYAGDGGGLKSISGGDTLRVNPKYIKAFYTKITALIMLVNNEPCRFTERAGGVERRRVIFDFQRTVPENERDPDLMNKITLEVGGIIRKVLDNFPHPEDAKKALDAQKNSEEALSVKMASDPLAAFFEYFQTSEKPNGLFVGNGNMTRDKMRTHLYPAYLAYVGAMNISELGLNTFTAGIEQALQQHGNQHDFFKTRVSNGVRTNIHFKNFDEFLNAIIG
ncbi:MAG: DUF5906 domain-containing protein [Lonepinella koalarum]|nr:DUF5906 domain-containing protein [Lonepinella koalarum]